MRLEWLTEERFGAQAALGEQFEFECEAFPMKVGGFGGVCWEWLE
jgi:hypothetical protein